MFLFSRKNKSPIQIIMLFFFITGSGCEVKIEYRCDMRAQTHVFILKLKYLVQYTALHPGARIQTFQGHRNRIN